MRGGADGDLEHFPVGPGEQGGGSVTEAGEELERKSAAGDFGRIAEPDGGEREAEECVSGGAGGSDAKRVHARTPPGSDVAREGVAPSLRNEDERRPGRGEAAEEVQQGAVTASDDESGRRAHRMRAGAARRKDQPE